MASAARVVAVQAADRVEPEQAAEVRELRIDWAAEAGWEGGLERAGETELLEPRSELVIEATWRAVGADQSQSGDGGEKNVWGAAHGRSTARHNNLAAAAATASQAART